MNNERRGKLADLVKRLEGIKTELESLKDDEQSAFDAMPEGLQSADNGQKSEQCVSYMDDADTELEAAIESINNAINE